eukprot:CAMPEP_0172620528 /NCGR_PEP_ID=MMETSP1068-20121228/104068_1 /TAXON_ID=35684 /ORGANISM="Pseudopedinella elastica, Strain CCMP716" /LENGTH=34 /DNA_ID= /DNA_START= /DNA_END= /DNA_ORIENTATION=
MTTKTMRVLENRDAEQEEQCGHAGGDKNPPEKPA